MNVKGWDPQSKVLVTRDLFSKHFVVTYVSVQETKQFLILVTPFHFLCLFLFTSSKVLNGTLLIATCIMEML